MPGPARALIEDLFNAAVAAAHPDNCLVPHLPEPPRAGRLIILGAGKAAGAMAALAERHYLDDRGLPESRLAGIAVTRHGYARPTRHIPLIEAGHPVPDAAGLAATFETLALADAAGPDDLVLVLLSGGASANWIAPAGGLSLTEKQALTRALIASGASIAEMNAVRKHLSRIKGGRLAARARPARMVTVAISDVPGDDPAVIGSGPTVPDPTTLADARATLARYGLDVSAAVHRALDDAANETPKPGDPLFAATSYVLATRPSEVFGKIEAKVRAAGYDCILLGTSLEGEARTVATEQARLAREVQAQGRRAVILSGGETDRHAAGQGSGRTEPGIHAGACHRTSGCERHRGDRGRYRRDRRRRRTARRPRRGLHRCFDPPSSTKPWPRSGRFSCRQQFDRIFCETWRSADTGTDLHQRERLSGYPR